MSAVMQEEEWVEVGRLDEIPRLGARVVRREGGEIAVFRTAGDQVFALLNRCPHRGGPLSEGIVYGQTVACPMHNWCLDLATGEAREPDRGCARSFATRIESGLVLVSARPQARRSAGAEGHGA